MSGMLLTLRATAQMLCFAVAVPRYTLFIVRPRELSVTIATVALEISRGLLTVNPYLAKTLAAVSLCQASLVPVNDEHNYDVGMRIKTANYL
jgi:hypothetical protein